jgi:hypothetical protein
MGDINWGQLHDESTTVLTGDFPVVITKAEAKQSQGGKPQFKLQLAIESGPYSGRKLPTSITISAESSGAMKMFFLHMAVLGLDKAYFQQNPSMERIAADLLGRRAVVTLEEREWQGRVSESVKAWKAAAGGAAALGSLSAMPSLGAGAQPLPAQAEQPAVSALPTAQPLPVATATAMPEDPFGDD